MEQEYRNLAFTGVETGEFPRNRQASGTVALLKNAVYKIGMLPDETM
jgi:hypothetical protein